MWPVALVLIALAVFALGVFGIIRAVAGSPQDRWCADIKVQTQQAGAFESPEQQAEWYAKCS
ncbi:hypothetical protein GTQ99_17430 [Kineococcus sp. T13]|uniref:hypothetical protein n=1 Tax=Kineococcus vitellinus TaxID=2696565 RepID=UPI0014122F29|nr:hypothetical protein [Kineococcus vitellinus]NAZ77191.1 hypothetical protein [Kineococcus vitellinus]